MATAKRGDTVRVHYEGRLDDGTVFDSSRGRAPLEVTLGDGRVIPGFERAIEGLEVGQRRTARVPPDEAYGPRSPELVLQVSREQFPVAPEVGQSFQLRTADGGSVRVRVTAMDGDAVEIDANHPLAGEVLTFDLELVEIE